LVAAAVGAFLALAAGAPNGEPPVSKVVRFDGAGGGNDVATSVAASPDGTRFFVTGYAFDSPEHGDDYVTIGYDADGRRLWGASYDGLAASVDNALAIGVDPAGERVFVTGNSFGGPETSTDFATVAYDAVTGNELWVKRFDGLAHGTDAGSALSVSPDGQTLYVTGATTTSGDGLLHAQFLAYDTATGSRRWASTFTGPPGATQETFDLGVTPDGQGLIAAGYQYLAALDYLAIRVNAATGAGRWWRAMDFGGEEVARALAVAPSKGLVVITGARSPGGGGRPSHPSGGTCVSGLNGATGASAASGADRGTVGADYVTVGVDTASGRVRWTSIYDGPAHDCDEAFAVDIDPTGSRAFVTGSSFGAGTDGDYATVAYGLGRGIQIWASRYDGPDGLYDRSGEIVVAPDGSTVYVTGVSTGALTDFDYATIAYETATGAESWSNRYDGPASGFDAPNGIAVGPSGDRLYVTGTSAGSGGIPDYATIVFRDPGP
jgi:DNA-binding beta-propeller fold protein YncE